MHIIHSLAIGSSIVLALSSPSLAATIVNGGFESPGLPPGGISLYSGGSNIGGWTVLGNDVYLIQSNYGESSFGVSAFTAQEGLNSLDLTGNANTGITDGVQQSISTNIGEIYRLSFFVGVAKGNGLYASPSILDLSINGGSRISFTNNNLVQGTLNWQQFSQDFTAISSSTTIAFFNSTATSSNNFVGLDNIQIGSATSAPEPLTIVGTLIGGTASMRMRKNIKSSSNRKN
jgi:Protein of unknown function (DUF642)